MADFFSSLFGGGGSGGGNTSQNQIIPQYPAIISPAEYYSRATGAAPAASAANAAYAVPFGALSLQAREQQFPGTARLQDLTTSTILSQLGQGTSIPEDVKQQVIQSALQGTAASGFGVSPGGRGLVAKDLGLTGLDLLNQRIGRAQSYLGQIPLGESLLPKGLIKGPEDTVSLDVANQNQLARQAAETAAIQSQNIRGSQAASASSSGGIFGSLLGGLGGGGGGGGGGNWLGTLGSLGGGILGGMYGGPIGSALGSSLGGMAGGALGSEFGIGGSGGGGGGGGGLSTGGTFGSGGSSSPIISNLFGGSSSPNYLTLGGGSPFTF